MHRNRKPRIHADIESIPLLAPLLPPHRIPTGAIHLPRKAYPKNCDAVLQTAGCASDKCRDPDKQPSCSQNSNQTLNSAEPAPQMLYFGNTLRTHINVSSRSHTRQPGHHRRNRLPRNELHAPTHQRYGNGLTFAFVA